MRQSLEALFSIYRAKRSRKPLVKRPLAATECSKKACSAQRTYAEPAREIRSLPPNSGFQRSFRPLTSDPGETAIAITLSPGTAEDILNSLRDHMSVLDWPVASATRERLSRLDELPEWSGERARLSPTGAAVQRRLNSDN
jgi:hypothetical protein